MSNVDFAILQRGIVGKGVGTDTYVLSNNLVQDNAKITLSDSGFNTLHLIDGLEIASSKVAANALLLTLSNGAEITVLDAANYEFVVGGDPITGETGTSYDLQGLASNILGVEVPTSGIASGGNTTLGQAASSGSDAVIESTMDTLVVQRGITGKGSGHDTYVLSNNWIEAGAEITITDTGNNTIQFIDGLEVSSSMVAPNALMLTLSNGATVTVLDADEYTFEVGGNPLENGQSNNYTFTELVTNTLNTDMPSMDDVSISNDFNFPINSISLPGNRSDYVINANDGIFTVEGMGISQTHTEQKLIKFEAGGEYLLRDTAEIIASSTSHLEAYGDLEWLVDLNVAWLHTGAYWQGFDGIDILENPELILQFPNATRDEVVTAYINLSELTGEGGWDPHWDPSWDTNGDFIIDVDDSQLPAYLQGSEATYFWTNYTARYWEDDWFDVLIEKVNVVMSQNFDGVMFDMTTGWQAKLDENPNAFEDMVILIKKISEYIHDTYGTTALATFNMGESLLLENPELASVVDGAYMQNSYYHWMATGEISEYYNLDNMTEMAAIFRSQDKNFFFMDHIDEPLENSFLDYAIHSIKAQAVPMIASHFFENQETYPLYRFGDQGDDLLNGWQYSDFFFTGGGNDVLSGNGGADTYLFMLDQEEAVITDYNFEDDEIIVFNASFEPVDMANFSRTQVADGSTVLFWGDDLSVTLAGVEASDPININGLVY